jgi:hypothetical protein
MKFAYQYVIWFEVRMQNVTFPHQTQAQEHLLSIGSDSLEVDANVTSEFLQDLTEVDAEVLKDHAQMLLVFEMSHQPDHMLLVFRVGFVEFLQYFNLL